MGAEGPRHNLARAVGSAALLWGYPLVESVRACRVQADARPGETPWMNAPIDRLFQVRRVATHRDRDLPTPANDLLYSSAWINLAAGPRLVHVPSSAAHGRRYFVLALCDAWTHNFANPGLRESPPGGERVLLVGPGTAPALRAAWEVRADRVIEAPTDLVWLLARVVAGPGDDLAAAQALQNEIRVEVPAEAPGRVPDAAHGWRGPVEGDLIGGLAAGGASGAELAAGYLDNLCRSLAEQGAPAAEGGMLRWLATARLKPDARFDITRLDAELQVGLRAGVRDGAAMLVAMAGGSRQAKPWTVVQGLGRFGMDYLLRSATAYRGIGAVTSDEALYGMADYDQAGQALDGRHRYVLRFPPDGLPPVDAFWSITLYAPDRFMVPNPIERHSIGDRTPGLERDADGGLTLEIGHAAPRRQANWLPAPAGRFYLALRMYMPRPAVRDYVIPAVTRSD